MVLATIHSVSWALLYLVLFSVGTILGMMLVTSALAVPMAYAATRFARVQRHMRWATGLASLAFGLFLVYQIGFVHGLFLDTLPTSR
jgi:high-affinity nickel-transport protein